MTIKELKKILDEYDENMDVEIHTSYDCGFGEAGGYIEDVYVENNKLILNNYSC